MLWGGLQTLRSGLHAFPGIADMGDFRLDYFDDRLQAEVTTRSKAWTIRQCCRAGLGVDALVEDGRVTTGACKPVPAWLAAEEAT